MSPALFVDERSHSFSHRNKTKLLIHPFLPYVYEVSPLFREIGQIPLTCSILPSWLNIEYLSTTLCSLSHSAVSTNIYYIHVVIIHLWAHLHIHTCQYTILVELSIFLCWISASSPSDVKDGTNGEIHNTFWLARQAGLKLVAHLALKWAAVFLDSEIRFACFVRGIQLGNWPAYFKWAWMWTQP